MRQESYEKGEHVFRNGTLLVFAGHLSGSIQWENEATDLNLGEIHEVCFLGGMAVNQDSKAGRPEANTQGEALE